GGCHEHRRKNWRNWGCYHGFHDRLFEASEARDRRARENTGRRPEEVVRLCSRRSLFGRRGQNSGAARGSHRTEVQWTSSRRRRSMSIDYPAYAYLGSHRWVRRERIPNSLLAKYDRYAVAEASPSAIDPATGRTFGGLWLDVVDQICAQVGPVLDEAAVLEDQSLRMRAAQRAFDAMVAGTRPARP